MDTKETIVAMPLTREEQIEATAKAQVAQVIAHFEMLKDKKATDAIVQKALADAGYDLEAITIQNIADDRMAQIKQRDNVRAGNELAKQLYKEQTGNDFLDD